VTAEAISDLKEGEKVVKEEINKNLQGSEIDPKI
jgi:hypothetical protein